MMTRLWHGRRLLSILKETSMLSNSDLAHLPTQSVWTFWWCGTEHGIDRPLILFRGPSGSIEHGKDSRPI